MPKAIFLKKGVLDFTQIRDLSVLGTLLYRDRPRQLRKRLQLPLISMSLFAQMPVQVVMKRSLMCAE